MLDAICLIAATAAAFVLAKALLPEVIPVVQFRQPGWWACFGSMLVVVLAFAVELILLVPEPSVLAAATVLVAWLFLGVARKWQSEPSWIDRTGRGLGVLWLGTIPIYLAGFVWNYLK